MVSVGVRRDVLPGKEDISISETAKVSLCTTPRTWNCGPVGVTTAVALVWQDSLNKQDSVRFITEIPL